MMSPWHGKAAASADSSAGFELTAELKYEFDVKDLGLLTPGAPGPAPFVGLTISMDPDAGPNICVSH